MLTAPRRTSPLAMGLAVLLLMGCTPAGSGRSNRASPATQPAPPAGTFARISVAPPSPTFDALAAFGRSMEAWTLTGEDLWLPLRALLLGVSDLGPRVDWTRPLHVLLHQPDAKSLRATWILPVKQPAQALDALARRCGGKAHGPIWRFTGPGTGLLPCRFHAQAVGQGLVVATSRPEVVAAVAHARHLLRPDAPRPSALEVRFFPAALRARLGLTKQKLTQWVDMGAVGLAMALGDFTAAGDLKARFARLIEHLDSLADVGVGIDVDRDRLELRLFATGKPGGALARWVASLEPRPLRLPPHLVSDATVALGLARTRPLPTPSPAKDANPGPVINLLVGKLPKPLQAPVRSLWTLLDDDAGEVVAALRTHRAGGLCLMALIEHPRPATVLPRWVATLRQLLTAAQRLPGLHLPKGTLQVTAHEQDGVQRISVTLPAATNALWTALRWLAGGDTLHIAVAARGRHVVVGLGAGAPERVLAALVPPRPKPVTGSPRARVQSGLPLGLIRVSLVELGRVVPGLVPAESLPTGPTGAVTLQWGVAPATRQLELRLRLPARHLKATSALWTALSKRLDQTADALPAWLTDETEPDDAL